MTEILERDECDGLEPDQWAGIHRHYDPRPQQWLDARKAEYLANGGVITVCTPQETPAKRKHESYYAYVPETKRAESPKRKADRANRDQVKLAIIREWLTHNEPYSRRSMAHELGMSEWLLARLLADYFDGDVRVAHIMWRGDQARAAESDAVDQATKELIQIHMDMGVRGYSKLARSTGLSENQLRRIEEKFDLNLRARSHASV